MTWAVVKVIGGGLASGGLRGRRRGSWRVSVFGSGVGLVGIGGASVPVCGFNFLKASVWARGLDLGEGAGERRAAAAAPTLWWRLKEVWAQWPRRKSASSEIGEDFGIKDGSQNWS